MPMVFGSTLTMLTFVVFFLFFSGLRVAFKGER